MHLFRYSLIIVVMAGICCKPAKQVSSIDHFNYTSVKKNTGKNGVVVSAHPLSSKVGLSVLQNGGNAVDAAIATQLALAVVFPNAGNLGGGGFMVARLSNGEQVALDYREMAPGAAHRDMYLDNKGNVIAAISEDGHLASGIPGTVAGLFESHKYAKLPFEKLIQPAIELAEKGYVITEREARSFNSIQEDLKAFNTRPTVFTKQQPWQKGDTLVQTELAQTLKRIRDQGRKGFYEGETADLIVAEMKRGKGIISLNDLKNYQAKWRAPHRFVYKGYTIIGMPMPSSGGVLVNQMMKMIEPKPLASFGFLTPRSIQLMVEVERRAYADRAEYMGDADFYKVPVQMLTNSVYLEKRMLDYIEGEVGDSRKIGPGKIVIQKESEETTHLSVIDKDGNAVAVTTTLNNSYGSKTVVGGAGFFLNDEMDDFSMKPGVPNMYGAVGGEANAIAPGKRMLSSMTPTIVLRDGKPFLVVGTPGGTTIPTSVFQTLLDIIEFNMSAEDAVNKPKFHHQWLPDEVVVEKAVPEETKDMLKAMGYKLREVAAIGRMDIIRVLDNGRFEGVADPRGDDSAEAW